MSDPQIHLWLWRFTDDFGKRRVTRYRLSEDEAHARLKDPVKVEGSLMIPKPVGLTSDFLKSLPRS